MQTKVNKPQELNISSTTTKTEIEQKKRKPQGRVEDRYYTIQEYKALSNEQKKEQKDLKTKRGHNPEMRKFNKGSVKGQIAALEHQVSVLQSNQGTNAGVAQNTTPSGTPASTNAPTNSEGILQICPEILMEIDLVLIAVSKENPFHHVLFCIFMIWHTIM